MKEVVVHGRTFELYLTAETITEKVSALAARLKADFKGKKSAICMYHEWFIHVCSRTYVCYR